MKIKTIMFSMLASAVLVGCSNDDDLNGPGPEPSTDGVAYVSINIQTQKNTRASSENVGEDDESKLNSLYFITFDANGKVLAVPGTTTYFTKPTTAAVEPAPFKVSAGAKSLLIVANPGTKLLEALNGLTSTSYFTTLNNIIIGADQREIAGGHGFTMINVGVEPKNPSSGNIIADALVDISGNIKQVTKDLSDADAQAAAKDDRASIKIERLASKIAFKLKNSIETKGATFNFQKWTIDAVNTEFFPFAEKTILAVVNSGTSYGYNFYTKDPNFSGTVGAGLDFATIDADYEPKLPESYSWMDEKTGTDYNKVYAIENTMDASYQQYGNATRLVVKGQYFPKDFALNKDWFNFAGVNYKSLGDLQTAYATAGPNLKTACDKFYDNVLTWLKAKAKDVTGLTGFANLTEAHLDQVTNGGEVVKDGKNDVIRWYQKGLCYYYNELRHDNESATNMSFGKYGVVRNNWYSLTLGSVNGPGTPWYPDVNKPGPGDPDPKDPIDEDAGYLGVEIEVTPWIIWEREIDF